MLLSRGNLAHSTPSEITKSTNELTKNPIEPSPDGEDDWIAAKTSDRHCHGQVSVQERILRQDDDETCYRVCAWSFFRELDGKLILRSSARNRCHDPRSTRGWIEIVRKQHDARSLVRGHVQRRGYCKRLARE